jgi:amino acid adenylation domain-containing protein
LPLAVSGFRYWAARKPAAIACRDDTAGLTYAELDARSGEIAAALRASGAGRGTIVGLMLPRSADFVAAALGVLRCGAAYLPLDREYPVARLALMVSQCGAPVLICNARTSETAAAAAGNATILDLDAHAARIAGTGQPGGIHPGDACYVIYTSGTTGAPKGVVVEHRNLDHLIRNHIALLSVTPESRGTVLASLTFDGSVMELWPFLCAGATIHIGPDLRTISVPQLARYLRQHRITHSYIPTALANSLARRLAADPGDLRLLLTGGDRLFAATQPRDFRLVNLYGPTEATVYATMCDVPTAGEGPVPLGLPVPGVHVHVLDADGRHVDGGQVGEIYLGGAGVARGYLGDPGMTGIRFVPDPFSRDSRLYRTGDLGSWRPDGQLEFHGRVDRQVKIRGYRIEPEEVEAVLTSAPEVEQAVVIACGGGPDAPELVAYVVPAASGCSAAAIRRRAAERLPDHMLPEVIQLVDEIPVTSAGKHDVAALARLAPR